MEYRRPACRLYVTHGRAGTSRSFLHFCPQAMLHGGVQEHLGDSRSDPRVPTGVERRQAPGNGWGSRRSRRHGGCAGWKPARIPKICQETQRPGSQGTHEQDTGLEAYDTFSLKNQAAMKRIYDYDANPFKGNSNRLRAKMAKLAGNAVCNSPF